MTIDQRIARVEKQNRRLKWALAALCVLAGAALVVGQAAPEDVPDVIRAKEFRVVNERGGTAAVLGAHEDGYGFWATYDAEGKPNAISMWGQLDLYAEGKRIVHLGPGVDIGGGLAAIFGPNGTPEVRLAVSRVGGLEVLAPRIWAQALEVVNKKGAPVVGLSADEHGNGSVFVHSATPEKKMVAIMHAEGSAIITIFDGKGVMSASVGGGTKGGGIELRDSNGNPRILIKAETPHGSGTIQVVDAKGKAAAMLGAFIERGGIVVTRNAEGNRNVIVGTDGTGRDGHIGIFNADGERLVELGALSGGAGLKRGHGAVLVSDPTGRRSPGMLTTRP